MTGRELMAARRDASFYACPAGFGHNPRPTKFHALVERGERGLGPACGIAFHAEDTEEPASGLVPSEKCGRPGCRAAFARDLDNRDRIS